MDYTPGPWHYKDGAVFCDSVPDTIARRSNTAGIPPEQRDANMRLCAAAPELLAALCRLVDHCAGDCPHDYDAIGEAIATIAKATGVQ